MAERHDKLRGTLHELEAELATLDSLDDETRAELETLVGELSDVLRRKETAAKSSGESLASRLKDSAEEFETSHPTLFGIVSRTIDALSQMGI